ncbi:MAG: amino acid permease [Candidatus Micrarchaeota archaeon]|nr:amino acid permease [Candidatus Micrarchaeota archaeon]
MQRLKRELTLLDALAINIGAIIGAGIFVISGIAAGSAGPAAIVSIMIGAAIAVFTGICYAELAHVYAEEGGTYEYSREILGNYIGFIAGFLSIIGAIIVTSAVSISFGGYFLSIFNLHSGSGIVAVALIAFLGAINYFGVKSSARASAILTVVKILVLAFFIVVGLFFIKPSNYVPFDPKGLNGIFVASAFIFFAYTGFARITNLGEEVKNAREVIPKAILDSIVISCVIYLLVMLVFIGMVPYGSVADSKAPLEAAVAYATHNPYFSYVIAAGALLATVNVALSMILGLSRVVFAMARDKNLPGSLSRLNRFGAPSTALAFSCIVMAVAVFAISFKEIVSLSNATALVSYTIANVAALKLYIDNRGKPGKLLFKSRYFMLVPLLGVMTTLFTLRFLTALSLAITAVLILAITAYYAAVRKANGPRR